MFYYIDYIKVLSQLSQGPAASFSYESATGTREILIEKSNTPYCWKLSTKIFDGEGALPKEVKARVFAATALQWREKLLLTLDPLSGTVYLVQELEVDPLLYSPLQVQVIQFIAHASEWENIVAGLVTA